MSSELPAYTLHNAISNSLPIVASIPHTGTLVPQEVQKLFINQSVAQLPMTDWLLHELYDFLPELGISFIAANYSRYVIDLNRSLVPIELYPGRFETKLVADKDFQGNRIFSTYPKNEQIEIYIRTIYRPYHDALDKLLKTSINTHGEVYLFDLHSIAKDATIIHAELDKDIYLGNRDNQSCSAACLDSVASECLKQDITIQKNTPYKGGFITHHYGLNDNVHALQIEMNQNLYMPMLDDVLNNYQFVIHSEAFQVTKTKLKNIFTQLINILKN